MVTASCRRKILKRKVSNIKGLVSDDSDLKSAKMPLVFNFKFTQHVLPSSFQLSRCYKRSHMQKELYEILEPLYLNGLQNYSSDENRKIIEDVVSEYGLDRIKIKRWIDNRKKREKVDNLMSRGAKVLEPLTLFDDKEIPKPLDVTPLNLERWKYYLHNCEHPDKEWVLEGIQYGFSLNSNPLYLESSVRNYRSAYHQPEVINSFFADEIRYGSIVGPYINAPFVNTHTNRIGVIPKSDGKHRVITDLSHPRGASVNDGISDEDAKVSYTGLTMAIKKVLGLGQGCLLSKFDLKRAYRVLAIKEAERHLLVMKWNKFYFVDLSLPFGLRSAPRTFSRFSDVLEWILMRHGYICNMQHSLDDFLICEPPGTVSDSLQRAFQLCSDLGIEIAHEKTQGPSTQITYLGVIIDTDVMEIRIPEDKLNNLRILLENWVEKKSCSKRSLLSLIGSLFYCCQVVLHGRPFIDNLVQRAHSVTYLYENVKLHKSEREDILWWFYLLNTWNGRSLLTDYSKSGIVTKLHS